MFDFVGLSKMSIQIIIIGFYAYLMQENPDLESQNHHFYLGSMFLRVFEGNWSLNWEYSNQESDRSPWTKEDDPNPSWTDV